MSPSKGVLREWLRVNLRIAVFLGIPAILVVPIITFTLSQFTTWTNLLATTVQNLILFPVMALLILGLVTAIVLLAKALGRNQRDRYC